MAKDVEVIIDLSKPSTGVGFGYPLIFEGKATTEIAYTECSTIQEVIRVVGGITDSDNEQAVATKTAAATQTNIYKAALLLFMQETAPSKIAVCATTTAATVGLATIMHKGWRQLIVTSNETEGEDTRQAISEFIGATADKMYFTSVNEVSEASFSLNDRTVVIVHEDDVSTVVFPEAAVVGATAGKEAGSINYKNTMLNGLTAKVLTDAEITAIHNAHAMCYVLKSGDGVTSNGKTTSDEYIDIIDAQDYIIQQIEYRIEKLLHNVDKITYDNAGIAMLENEVVTVLQEAANNNIIALDADGVPEYSVTFADRAETSASDRAARHYSGGTFEFALAGAIDTVKVKGTIMI